jgi:hypothetical protein
MDGTASGGGCAGVIGIGSFTSNTIEPAEAEYPQEERHAKAPSTGRVGRAIHEIL